MKNLSTDMIVGLGLVVALILNIALGGEAQVTMNISTGLVGWLGITRKDLLSPKDPPAAATKPPQKEASKP